MRWEKFYVSKQINKKVEWKNKKINKKWKILKKHAP